MQKKRPNERFFFFYPLAFTPYTLHLTLQLRCSPPHLYTLHCSSAAHLLASTPYTLHFTLQLRCSPPAEQTSSLLAQGNKGSMNISQAASCVVASGMLLDYVVYVVGFNNPSRSRDIDSSGMLSTLSSIIHLSPPRRFTASYALANHSPDALPTPAPRLSAHAQERSLRNIPRRLYHRLSAV